MTGTTIHPTADRSAWYADTFPGSVMPHPNVVVLHTTEQGSDTFDYQGGAVAPTFTLHPDGRLWQHFPVNMSARALVNAPGGVETNTLNVVQVELMGTCVQGGPGYYWPGADDTALGHLADLLKWLHAEWPIPLSATGRPWLAYPASKGSAGGQRMTATEWLNFNGVCGHQHVPENDHGDPGAFPIGRLLALCGVKPDLWIPDVSEFQTVTSLPEAAIVRAHNGWRADNKWTQFAEIAKRDCRWWGAYQYLPASVDPTHAASLFLSTLGGYRPNVVILDLEEGSGDQLPRLQAWHDAIQWPAEWTYSGLNFARTRNLTGRVEWIAAYQSTEPSDAHQLWQATDARTFPGIAARCDGSVFHGTVDDLIKLTAPTDFVSRGTSAPVAVPAPTTTGGADVALDANDIAAIAQAVWTRFGIHTPDGKVIDLQTALGRLLADAEKQ